MNKFVAVAMLTVAIGVLTACGSSAHVQPTPTPTGAPTPSVDTSFNNRWEGVSAIVVKVDGKQYNCVTYRYDRGGGISCDWDHPITK